MPGTIEGMNKSKKIDFENLNGLRFLCFLSVFLFHSFHTTFEYIENSPVYRFVVEDLFGNGNLGVNFFFVLSGFLITYLLIEEKKLNGQIDVKRFWLRRILRIWPLFYLCVIFGFYLFPILKTAFGQSPNETATIYYYLTFTNNFEFIKKGPPDASILGVLWSIAVEEQFYLIWPIILFAVPIKRCWIVFILIIGGSIVFRWLHDNHVILDYHTLSCIGDMSMGGLGAWLSIEHNEFKSRIINLKKIEVIAIYLLFVLIFLFRDEALESTPWIKPFERAVISVTFLAIILEQNYAAKSLFKMSQFKLVSSLGVTSYGLYCLHFVGILITTTLTNQSSLNTHLWQVLVMETVCALSITIVISKVSYEYYEKPFLKLKEKFAYITR